MTLPERKQALRDDLRRQRRDWAPSHRSNASAHLLQHLRQAPGYATLQRLHLFLGLADEPDTQSWLPELWADGKQVSVPCVVPGTAELEHARLNPDTPLVPGAWGLLEPPPEQRDPVLANWADWILVPGLAFDRQGGRLGYGKGFYDRFLETASGRTLGVGFAFQVVPEVPCEAHDVPLHGLLTEQGLSWLQP